MAYEEWEAEVTAAARDSRTATSGAGKIQPRCRCDRVQPEGCATGEKCTGLKTGHYNNASPAGLLQAGDKSYEAVWETGANWRLLLVLPFWSFLWLSFLWL